MLSLQSRLLSLLLRWRFKRRPAADDAEFVRAARRLMNDPRLIPRRVPPGVTLARVERPDVCGEWVAPEAPRATVIYFHGGGYIGGSVETYRRTTFALAQAAGARVFALDYRLAPEHRFPCAVEDGLAAYRYVLKDVRGEAGRVAFVGDSAGGGLLLATMLRARGEGLPLPAAAVCFSPLTDLAMTGGSLDANDRRCVMFYGDSVRRAAPIYLGGADARDPLASPLYADLRGLPPLQIFASSSETLLDDALRLAAKAKADGVTVDLQVWRNLPHVWPIFTRQLPEARRALRLTAEFIKAVTGDR